MEIQYRFQKNKTEVFDPIRKKWVACTPEEQVRQQLVILLLEHSIPFHWIAIEKELNYFRLKKRFDLLIIRPSDQKVLLLAECKAPKIPISIQTFEQIASYHAILKPQWWLLTNGNETLVFQPTHHTLYTSIPSFEILSQSFQE